MTLSSSTYELTTQDRGLIDETIRRVGRTIPLTARDQRMLETLLPAELGRGRRDLFSLVRAARKAIELG